MALELASQILEQSMKSNDPGEDHPDRSNQIIIGTVRELLGSSFPVSAMLEVCVEGDPDIMDIHEALNRNLRGVRVEFTPIPGDPYRFLTTNPRADIYKKQFVDGVLGDLNRFWRANEFRYKVKPILSRPIDYVHVQ